MTGRTLRRGNWSVQELERLRQLLPRRGVEATAALLRRSPDSVRRRAQKLLRAPQRRAAWSESDTLALRRAWGAVEPRLLAVMLGRPMADVLQKASALRTRQADGPWSRDELGQLKRLYGSRADADLEVCLLRSAESIREAARALCLQKDKRFQRAQTQAPGASRAPRWTAAEVVELRRLYAEHDNLEVAHKLGRTVQSVANKAFKLGLQKSPALLQRIGRDNVSVRFAVKA